MHKGSVELTVYILKMDEMLTSGSVIFPVGPGDAAADDNATITAYKLPPAALTASI